MTVITDGAREFPLFISSFAQGHLKKWPKHLWIMMKGKKLFKRVLLIFLIAFIAIQFVRPDKNSGPADSPADITHFVQVPDTILAILKTSCYDCHSNHTNYPWDAEVAPSSWWLANHIKNGKAELNFSEFGQYTARRRKSKLTSIADQVEKREMPLKSYLLLHGNAKLSDAQIQLLVNWTDSAKAEIERK